jgi:hypothetical protein
VRTLRLIPQSGAAVELTSERTIMGRDASCDVTVDDRTVSRSHARIERREQAWFVVDQSSANGTYLGGERISEGPLQEGQELRLGAVSFRIEIGADGLDTLLIDRPDLDRLATLVMPDRGARPSAIGLQAASTPFARPTAPPVAGLARAMEPPVRPMAPPLGLGPSGAGPRPQGPPANASAPEPDGLADESMAGVDRRRGETSDVSIDDLPSAEPVVMADLIDISGPPKPSSEPPAATSPAPARLSGELMPAPALYLTIAATLLIALSAFFSLKTGKLEKEITKKRSSSEFVKGREEARKYASALPLLRAGVLKNGKLKLCSKASVPLQVGWLGAVYLKPEDLPPAADRKLADLASGFKVASYNSGFCGKDFNLVLPPGAEQAVKFSSTTLDRCNWDGSALFFVVSLERPEAAASTGATTGGRSGTAKENVWISGLLGDTQECVSLGAGW